MTTNTRSRALRVVLPLLCALLTAGSARADQVTLAASRDNTLFSEDGTLSNGAGDHLFAGNTKDGFTNQSVT